MFSNNTNLFPYNFRIGSVNRSGGVLIFGLLMMASVGTGFVLNIFLANQLSPQAYGDFVYAISTAIIGSSLAAAGYPQVMIRYLAIYRQRGQCDRARFLQTFICFRVCTLAILAGIGTGLWLWLLPISVSLTSSSIFIVSLLAAVVCVLKVLSGSLRSLDHKHIAILGDSGLREGFSLFALLISSCFIKLTVFGALSTMCISALLTAAFLSKLYISKFQILFPGRTGSNTNNGDRLRCLSYIPAAFRVNRWSRMSRWLFANSFWSAMIDRGDILLVGLYLGATEVGAYFLISRTIKLMALPLRAISIHIGPRVAVLAAEGRVKDLEDRLTQLVALLAILGGASGVLLMLFLEFGMKLMVSDFQNYLVAASLLILGQIINLSCGPVNTILAMSGHERYATYAKAMGGSIQLALIALLVPLFGLAGSACGTLVGMVVWNLSALLFARRALGLRLSVINSRHLVRVHNSRLQGK